MAFEIINGDEWFREELYNDTALSVKVKEKIVDCQSKTKDGIKLQDIVIIDTEKYGKMLVLDGIFQTSERDEIFYHEPIVHFAMFSHPNPKRVLIIGGGDGGAAREVLKHNVEIVDLVEIDPQVIELTCKYMPALSDGAFDNPKLGVYFEDGYKFIEKAVKEYKKYDVIIVDSPDPVGPAVSLFTREFYLGIKKILSEDGIVVRQTGSIFLQEEEMPTNYRHMKEIFSEVCVFTSDVPLYQGGIFSFTAASNMAGIFNKDLEEIRRRYYESGVGTIYYSPEMHIASMKLPHYIQNSLSKVAYGEELVIDMAGCDQEIIKSEAKMKEFAAALCDVIKMKSYGDTIVEDFGHAKARTSGFTVVQLIETSSIVAHISNYWGYVCLNIFTCAKFDPIAVISFVKEFFKAEKIKATLIKRGEFLEKEIQTINLTDTDYFSD
jgi:spermidine synthase